MKLDQRYHCFGCGADGDVIDFTAALYGLGKKEAAVQLAQDFELSYEDWKPPGKAKKPKPRQKSPEEQFQEAKNRCFRILADYRHLLRAWRKDYAPHSPEEAFHPRFVEALQKQAQVEYLLDVLLFGETEEKAALITDYGKDVIFNSAEESKVIKENPSKTICARGGKPAKRREALTDEQTAILLDSIRELPPYVFVMIGLYAGLRREEILGLKWDCVFLDEKTPYISVRRAWHVEGGEPVVNTLLKTPAAKRDVPIPKCLVACLKEEREKSESEYVISNSKGTVLTETQFVRVWKYITVRSTAERCYYTYVNGQSIKHRIKPRLGEHQPNNPKLVYTMDFKVTPHMLRHTYITNLIYKGVDPKTVQYLAGHENSKTTMDIYAKVKYNKPEELSSVVNAAFGLR